MAKDKDLVMRGLEALANGAVAPVMAAVDFVANGGEFSDEGKDHAMNAILPDVDDLLSDD